MSSTILATRVDQPTKLPGKDVLRASIRGLRKKIRSEVDPEKRHRLKKIKRELQWLKDQL